MSKTGYELHNTTFRDNPIDQAIYESEMEMAEGGEGIELDVEFSILNDKYYESYTSSARLNNPIAVPRQNKHD